MKKRKPRVLLTPAEKKRILELGMAGETYRDIEKKTGRSSTSILRVFRENGIEPRGHRHEYSEEEVEIIKKKYPVLGAKNTAKLLNRDHYALAVFARDKLEVKFSKEKRDEKIVELSSSGLGVAEIAEQLMCTEKVVARALPKKNLTYLHIAVRPEEKSAWVGCANRKGKKLKVWVTEVLNEAARKSG